MSCRPSPPTGRSTRSAGEISDGYVWGRGAVDMKDFDAILLAVIRERTRAGRAPRRPIRLVFTADEEAGGPLGCDLARQHPPGTDRRLQRGDR